LCLFIFTCRDIVNIRCNDFGLNEVPYIKKGAPYDAYHIIENVYGGPHEWWNIHPASNPIEHQVGIHAKDAIIWLIKKQI
jgi:hypothetical protein